MSEEFIVSARKYRPQTFDTVVGQKSVTSTLRNAIKNNHLAQAFLFCGSRGVGKTTTARILAKTINCFNRTEDIEACETCESCVSFNEGASLNVYELDAASNNSVDDIRNLIDQVRLAPQLGTHKVYIIDEVHMLSNSAFNAFLKTLEEPPKHAIFILATTEKHKIIPTILSRCQIFDFNRIKVKDIADHLANIAVKESITADPEALFLIAQKADGALRDALSIFDQIVTFAGNNISYQNVIDNLNVLDYDYYFRIVDLARKENIPDTLLLFNEIMEKGFDAHNFIVGLSNHFRNLLVCKDVRTANLLEVGEIAENRYIQQAKEVDSQTILRSIALLSKADVDYKQAKNQRLLVEILLMQLCSLKQELEKKKCLTDPVSILPFPGQSLREKQTNNTVVNKPSVPSISQQMMTKPAPKVLQTAGDKVVSTNLSIKKLLKPQNPENDLSNNSNANLPRESFHFDDVKMAWRRFATTMKQQGRETFYNAMIKRNPVPVSDTHFRMEVDNLVQVDLINADLEKLTTFMRNELKNFDVFIEVKVTENVQEDVKHLTGKDKFAMLARKFPNLHSLKNAFNLEIEY